MGTNSVGHMHVSGSGNILKDVWRCGDGSARVRCDKPMPSPFHVYYWIVWKIREN